MEEVKSVSASGAHQLDCYLLLHGDVHLPVVHLGLIYKPTSKPQPRLFHFIKESHVSRGPSHRI